MAVSHGVKYGQSAARNLETRRLVVGPEVVIIYFSEGKTASRSPGVKKNECRTIKSSGSLARPLIYIVRPGKPEPWDASRCPTRL